MKEEPSVLVVGCSSQFYEGEKGISVTTEGIKGYIEHLDESFECIEFFSEKGYGCGSTSCLLNIDSERLHTQSTSNPGYFFIDIVNNSKKVLRYGGNQELITLVYVPSMFSFLLSPILLYKSDKTILYYMSDTEKVMWNNNFIFDTIKDCLYRFFDYTLLSNADAVLYRDESVTDRSPRKNQKQIRSKPILSLNMDKFCSRKDTCNKKIITLLYVGSLIERKGVNYLIQAFDKLQNRNKGPRYELKIVGDGDKREELMNLCKDLEVSQSVEFTGHISEEQPLLKEYRTSDVFVLPSLEEGFPRVITEAMSQSLPVITTRVGEIDERLDGDEAIIIEPESTNDIMEAICEIVSNEKMRKNLIKNGRSYAENILSKSAADQHVSLIQSLSKQK